MLNKIKDFNWVEKYRPRTLDDCVLSDDIKSAFRTIKETKELPNCLFFGTAGTGKTTLAKAICNDIQADVLFINASLERGIDVIRDTIRRFASSTSIDGGRKVVILDEACQLTRDSMDSLKSFMETYSSNCSFILTANHPNKLTDPLHSRLVPFEFN